jgi:endonuclease III
MKDSKQYSRKVQKLYRSLKRKYAKTQKVLYDEPVESLVYAVISEKMSETSAQSAIKRFAGYFVDFNDLRVSRAEEIVEVLGADTPVTRDIALALAGALRSVFDKYNAASLMALRRTGKRPARQVLEKMNGVSPFVVNYCMLTSLQGHAIPLTRKMIDYLRSSELVHPDADEQEIEGFLARQISAQNAYEFYALLRRQSESYKAGKRRKTAGMAEPKAVRKAKKGAKKVTTTRKRKK